ncbi:helix-turn-helix transcriptional regulator [Saccharopolyspora sp. ID03-671]|uniref:helix-turn-helix domain-containing protein n=1 Tax=Saccharopolyspora sp. ID03-671 TaxID=3073066 RepID=UPI00324A6090
MSRTSKLFHLGLGAELQRLREQSGMTTRTVGEKLGTSASSVSRTETGSRRPAPDEVGRLCDLFGVTGKHRGWLIEKARDPRGETARLPREDAYADQLANVMQLESEAVRIVDFELSFVPGLLQTAEYARAIISAIDRPAGEIERRIAIRLGRQSLLTRPDGADLEVLLDEAVLHRQVAGPVGMRRQIERLQDAVDQQQVTLRVIPASVGAYLGMEGSFTNYHLVAAGPYVYMETARGGTFLTEEGEVAKYLGLADAFHDIAMSQHDTYDLLTEIKESFR